MEYFKLPPTEKPFGSNCQRCELFTDGECRGVSTVRMIIGVAQKIEAAMASGQDFSHGRMTDPAVARSFRVLQETFRYCPGAGNDGRGDFRKSPDKFSGYNAAMIIRTALDTVVAPEPSSPTPQLRCSSISTTPQDPSISVRTLEVSVDRAIV